MLTPKVLVQMLCVQHAQVSRAPESAGGIGKAVLLMKKFISVAFFDITLKDFRCSPVSTYPDSPRVDRDPRPPPRVGIIPRLLRLVRGLPELVEPGPLWARAGATL